MNALLWAVFAVLIVAVVGGIVGAVYVVKEPVPTTARLLTAPLYSLSP